MQECTPHCKNILYNSCTKQSVIHCMLLLLLLSDGFGRSLTFIPTVVWLRYNKWIGLGAHRKLSSYLSAIQLWMAELAFRVQVIIRCWWCATAFQWRTSTGNGFFLSVFFFLSIFFWLLMTMRTRCATPPCLPHFRNASAQWFGRSSSSRLRYVLRVILTPFYRHNSNKASTMQALWFMNGKKIIRKTQSQRTY